MQTQTATTSPQYVYQNVIPDLLNWSLPWITALSVVCLFIGGQSLAVSYQDLSLADRLHGSIWQFAKAISFFNLTVCFFRLSNAGRNYVKTEQEKELSPFVIHLNVCWTSLAIAMVATFTSSLSKMANGIYFNIDPTKSLSLIFFGIVAVVVTALNVFAVMGERKMAYAKGEVLKNLHSLAARNLTRLRFASVFGIAGGVALLFYGAADAMYDISDYGNQGIAIGFLLAAIGGSIQFYRRTVRDVHRNAVPTFFERALNRLNFFWLLCTIFSSLLFFAAFL